MKPIKNADDFFHLLDEKDFLGRFGLKRIGLFGSLARGEKFNDIDLLVDEDIDYKKLLELKELLQVHTGYKVDIVDKKFAEPLILYRALKDIRYAAASKK